MEDYARNTKLSSTIVNTYATKQDEKGAEILIPKEGVKFRARTGNFLFFTTDIYLFLETLA